MTDADADPVTGGGRLRRWARQPYVVVAAVVGACYFVAAFVIFRDVIVAIPSVLRGDSVVVGDELVPYFNPNSQLLDQAKGEFSELTNGFEFRVRYSFLTTWVRHYQVLPFAILLMLPAIAWAAYLTVSWFVARVFDSLDRTTVYVAAAFPTALFYLIAVYAKITHFYTLVLGLMLMTASVLIVLDALLFRHERWWRRMALACVVAALNPAVHYLVLFTLVVALSVTTLLLGELSRSLRTGGLARLRPSSIGAAWARRGGSGGRRRRRAALRRVLGSTTGRCVVLLGTLFCVTLVPYALFVKFVALRGVENLSETVPGDYYFIRDASVSLIHALSWDLAGIMDKIQFGDYLAKTPRVSNIIYTLLFLAPMVVPWIRRSLFRTRAHRQLLGIVCVNAGFATWATVGYAEPGWLPTFHRSLAATTRALHATDSPVGDLTLALSSTVVQVLRFPHRFQLILFVLAPVVTTLAVAWAVQRVLMADLSVLHRRSSRRVTTAFAGTTDTVALGAIGVAIGTIFFSPFFANDPYREVYGSGDFSGFAADYPVDELSLVKDELEALPQGKTIVLPPTETAKLVVAPDGVEHKFIDKFYIYYLDQPSFYYGLTGDSTNKFEFFLMLRSLYYQQDWWVNIARDIGLEYVVLNKQVENNRGVGAEYLPDIETYLREQLEAVPDHVTSLYENDSFVLYRVEDTAPVDREVLLFDTSWRDYLDTVFARLDLSRCYDFRYISNYEAPGDATTTLLATDPRDAALDLWSTERPGSFSAPSSKIFAFNPDVVASSYYLSPMFRLFLFFSDTKWNRTEMITPGIFGTLDGSFVGVPRSTRISIPTTVPQPGRYRVLLRAAATANELTVTAAGPGFSVTTELRSPPDALEFFHVDEIYEPSRRTTDTSGLTVADLEELVPSELVPVNHRFVYHDLGTVDAAAGTLPFVIDKHDDNPMLVEGLLLVPEDEYVSLALPDDVVLVDDPSELRCSGTSPVRAGVADGTMAGVENGPHADLEFDEMLDLIGVDLETADPDGLGGRWQHVVTTLLIVLGCLAVIRWRSTRRIDDDDADPAGGKR